MQAAKRDAAMILADTSIVPPSLWRDHEDSEMRAFFKGPRLNPRSVAYAEAEAEAEAAGGEPGLNLNTPRRKQQ
jgi:hypothetical protein